MKVHEIMTAHARTVAPDNTLVEAAGLMRELDVGALPVLDGGRLMGIVTDRDLVVRGVADGRDPNVTSVDHVFSSGVVRVFADEEVEEAARLMEEKQIRRLLVVDRAERLVGIVSLGDLANASQPAFSGMALRDVSAPSNPSARQRRLQEISAADAPARNGATAQPRGTRRIPASSRDSGGRTKRTRKHASRSHAAAGNRTSKHGAQKRKVATARAKPAAKRKTTSSPVRRSAGRRRR
ncbi:MAG TPA: CBS domain-containing protein [Opitutaceae bacterium]|nr:CBS domain-containing protein [Opitutaceae bacterium]